MIVVTVHFHSLLFNKVPGFYQQTFNDITDNEDTNLHNKHFQKGKIWVNYPNVRIRRK